MNFECRDARQHSMPPNNTDTGFELSDAGSDRFYPNGCGKGRVLFTGKTDIDEQ